MEKKNWNLCTHCSVNLLHCLVNYCWIENLNRNDFCHFIFLRIFFHLFTYWFYASAIYWKSGQLNQKQTLLNLSRANNINWKEQIQRRVKMWIEESISVIFFDRPISALISWFNLFSIYFMWKFRMMQPKNLKSKINIVSS